MRLSMSQAIPLGKLPVPVQEWVRHGGFTLGDSLYGGVETVIGFPDTGQRDTFFITEEAVFMARWGKLEEAPKLDYIGSVAGSRYYARNGGVIFECGGWLHSAIWVAIPEGKSGWIKKIEIHEIARQREWEEIRRIWEDRFSQRDVEIQPRKT